MMTKEGFLDYCRIVLPIKDSGAPMSYIKAIVILDEIFKDHDLLGIKGQSLFTITDRVLLDRITLFVKDETRKVKRGDESIFRYGKSGQTSYSKGGFCSAAMNYLLKYQEFEVSNMGKASILVAKEKQGKALAKKLTTYFDLENIDKRIATDREAKTKVRIGQEFFRRMLLHNYDNKCCVTGLDVPNLLRASHILPWANNVANRLNPENGLLLSATYDAAFDQHLISFDEDYRMIVSKEIKDHYTTESTREYFDKFEGKKIILPKQFLPSQAFLEKHRNEMVG